MIEQVSMSLPAEPDTAESAPRLHNGRRQACETCRRRKVACDHRVPVCSRCVRQGLSESCKYVFVRGRTKSVLRDITPAQRPRQFLEDRTFLPNSPNQPENSNGYLGATNFSAVFQDSADLLAQGHRVLVTPYKQPANDELEIAMSILDLIPDRITCKRLLQDDLQCSDGWSRLVAYLLNESIWGAFGSVLERSKRDVEGLASIADILFRNSSTSFREDYNDPMQWLESFSGSNLRWEALGILFAYWALGSKSLINAPEQRETPALRNHDRRDLIMKYKNGARLCLDLCRRGASANTLLACLLHKYSILESVDSGDASPQLWRLLGEIAALATFLGLHATAPSLLQDHSITSEMKRRLYIMIYKNDKAVATFTGRPPLLSAKYATTPLPLDISDEELLFGNRTPPANYRLRIDSNGWSTTGEVYPMTVQRSKGMIAIVREEILEMALQVEPGPDEPLRLDKLKEKHLKMVASFPASLTYKDSDINDSKISSATLVGRLTTRISELQNLFFIERLQNRNNALPSADFLDISFELVSLPLLPWKHPERLATLRGDDCTWMVLSYAAPAAGVLAMELLRGNTSGIRESSVPQRRVTRSSIIQLLGMLCCFLDTVGPAAPNTDCCYTVHKTIQSVLDRALNIENQMTPAYEMNWVGDWGMELSLDMTDLFNYDLPDTFNWMRNPI